MVDNRLTIGEIIGLVAGTLMFVLILIAMGF